MLLSRQLATTSRQKIHLDVLDVQSIEQVWSFVHKTYGHLHVLVNNAAVLYDTWETVLTADLNTVHDALETNTFGASRLCQAFVPLLRQSRHGRIVNVSSEAASLASMGYDASAYNLSKVALNALTRMLAAELLGTGILVNPVCPGWVATDMGGSGGRPIECGLGGYPPR